MLERLTAGLPEWFGLPVANRAYAEQAERLPGYVATVDGEPCGLLLLKRHSAVSAEIYWLGVDRRASPLRHRPRAGRGGLRAARGWTASRFLFVHTLHPKVVGRVPYARTRRFYEAIGFRYVLEPQVPPDANPLGIYMKTLQRVTESTSFHSGCGPVRCRWHRRFRPESTSPPTPPPP